MRIFENRVMRKMFTAKRKEVAGEWRRLHNEELYILCPSPIVIRVITSRRLRWAGHVARMGEKRDANRVLVGKPVKKKPLERSRRGWEDNIKTDLREVGWGTWTGSIWLETGTGGGLAGSCECGNEPSGFIKCWEFLDYLLRMDSAPGS